MVVMLLPACDIYASFRPEPKVSHIRVTRSTVAVGLQNGTVQFLRIQRSQEGTANEPCFSLPFGSLCQSLLASTRWMGDGIQTGLDKIWRFLDETMKPQNVDEN